MSDTTPSAELPATTPDDHSMGMAVHLLSIVAGFLGPVIILVVKQDSPFVKFHALQSLYLNLLALPLIFLTCGVAAFGVIVIDILWALKAKDGEWARIPLVGDWAWPADVPRAVH